VDKIHLMVEEDVLLNLVLAHYWTSVYFIISFLCIYLARFLFVCITHHPALEDSVSLRTVVILVADKPSLIK
jgi:hypothetical protein